MSRDIGQTLRRDARRLRKMNKLERSEGFWQGLRRIVDRHRALLGLPPLRDTETARGTA